MTDFGAIEEKKVPYVYCTSEAWYKLMGTANKIQSSG
jgi:hypothetical protein